MNQGDQPASSRFTILRYLGAGGMGKVYAAFDNERNMRVAIKQLPSINPAAIYRFKQEFRSLAEIVHPNLVPLYELMFENDQWFFTMELVDDPLDYFPRRASPPSDAGCAPPAVGPVLSPKPTPGFDATTLVEESAAVLLEPDRTPNVPEVSHPNSCPLAEEGQPETDFGRVRDVFRQIAAGVHFLHQAGKLHRDLKPANVLVRKSGQVVVLDFGLVVEVAEPARMKVGGGETMTHSTRLGDVVDVLAGTVAYMSPEQVELGRLTSASDWYAFGVMLFQVLTGRLPFEGQSVAILRNKTTEPAPSPGHFRKGIPSDLEDLCARLLERAPGKRPTGEEILARLSGAEFRAAAAVEPISIAALPFVGREKELATLMAAFQQTRSGRSIVCHVYGPSGAGKSALINRFLNQLAEESSVIILTGRCYEQESVPYKGIDSVIDALTRYLLRLPESAIADLLPPDTGALPRVFPVLSRVGAVAWAEQVYAAASDPQDLRRRAFSALRGLLLRLGQRNGLVIHIDDLQWGDLDSASLLGQLQRQPNAPQMLLLLSYRSEYTETSPCLKRLAEWQVQDVTTSLRYRIEVAPFGAEETKELALALLGNDTRQSQSMTEWIVRESGGRAFFVYELVRYLQSGMDRSLAAGLHLDQVLWNRISRLPADGRKLLEVVAVAGRPVSLRHVQRAGAFASLPPHVVAGLRANHLVRTSGPGLDDDIETFHDAVRESVIAHLTAETRVLHHSCLAASLEEEKNVDPETVAFHLEGGNQLNRAGRFYVRAAEQAERVLAFDRAEDFHKRSARLLESPMERIAVQERLIHFYTNMARFRDAYAVARTAVKQFGISLPANFSPPRLIASFIKSKFLLRGRKAAQLLELPRMTDPGLEVGVRLINAVAKAAYQIRPELCVAVSTQSVNLCLRHGNTPDCAVGYMVYGAIFQGGVMGNYPVGYDFGRLALDLVEKYRKHEQRAEVSFVVGYFGTAWLKPATEAEALWEIAYRAGLETKDLFHTGCACAGTIMSQYIRGVPAAAIIEKARSYRDCLKQHHLHEPMGVVTAVEQAVANLRGLTNEPETFTDKVFDEGAFAAELHEFGSRHFVHFYYILKMQSLYLWGKLERAARIASVSQRFVKDSVGMLHSTEHHFYRALILAELAATRSGLDRLLKRRAVAGIWGRFQKWSRHCPQNFQSRAHLLAGVCHALGGRLASARAAFGEARQAAEQYGSLPLKGLGWLLEARQLIAHRELDEARRCLAAGADCWRRWGADGYADQIHRIYPIST